MHIKYHQFVGKEPLPKQAIIEQGKLINPNNRHKLDATETGLYNTFTKEFNSTNQRDIQEFLLDQRFNFFVSCGEPCKPPRSAAFVEGMASYYEGRLDCLYKDPASKKEWQKGYNQALKAQEG